MMTLFRRAFGIYPGEGRSTLRFVRLALFWSLCSSCLDTLSDGLFLEHVGASGLPQVYLMVAIGMIGVSSLVLYSLKVSSSYRVLTSAIGFGIAISLLSALIVQGGAPPDSFWYGLKIASRMFFTVMIACSWTFVDQYHDLQDAKRVYSLYSAAYFFGTILSGTVINLLLDPIGFHGLFLLAAIAGGWALVEAKWIAEKTTAIHDDTQEGVFSGTRDSFAAVVQMIIRSRFAVILMSLSLFVQLLITVSEFSYMETFGQAFAASPAGGEGQIAEFLGKCRAIISACNLILGVFFYNRFLRRIGLVNAILITPLFFLCVYSGWLVSDTLLWAVLALVAVDGVLFTIEDNCFNLLSNAVPLKLRSRVRIINDSFFEPIGMLLSALLLLGIQEESRWLGFSLTLAVLVLALAIRSSYATALLANLKENAIHFDRKLKTWMHKLGRREQKEAKKAILDALSSRDEELQLLACEGLLQLGDPATLPHALGAAQRLGTLSKIHFLRLLEATPFRDDSRAIETIDQWAASDSAELAKWANFYLAKRGLHHPEKIEGDIDHPDLMYRGAAILTLKKSVIAPVDDVALNRTIASKKLDLMLKSSHIDEISLGLEILAEDNSPEAAERALPFLSHEAVIVKRTAAKCLSRLASKQISRHTPRVIEALEEARDNPFRLYCLDALGKIGDSTTVRPLLLASVHFRPSERRRTEEALCQMGLKIVPLLLALTKEVSMPERARILAGKALGKLALAQLQANLIDIIDIEIERAYFYFYFGHTIQHRYPLYDLEMLKSALLTGYQSVIDFVIHLLGAAGSLEDPDLLVRALHSRNAKIHSHAVESLEKTCDPRLFRLIAPLVDDLPLEEKMSACLRWYGDFPELTLSELLAKLEQSPSLFDKIAAARLKSGLQMPNWRQELREQMKHSDEQFHQFAYELLDEAIKPD